ncbi:uncharacterized protein [Oscarella lobularis]|uniref:uncharacterized protein isoform X2 n=1 Tax=Oscarella lobularis TaxID=121494 RepID=UPI003313E894
MNDRSIVLCSGFVTKRGRVVKNWKRRYFTLNDDGSLFYYKGSRRKGAISVSQSASIRRKTDSPPDVLWPSNATDGNSLAIFTPNRQLYAIFESRSDFKRWCLAFKKFVSLPESILAELSQNQKLENLESEINRGGREEEKEQEEVKYLENLRSQGMEASSDELIASHFIEKIVDVMKRKQEIPAVQVEACWCLHSMSLKSKRLRNHCVNTEALELVRTAMKLHQNLDTVQLPGILFIQSYVNDGDAMVRNRALDDKYIRRICCGIKASLQNQNVIEAGLITLWDIATVGALDWVCQAYINAGVFPMIIDILRGEDCSPLIAEAAFCLVSSLLSYDTMAEAFLHCGGIGMIFLTLRNSSWSSNSETIRQTLTLVLLLVAKSEKARESLVEKDIVSILLQYIREEDGDLQMTSLSILLELACIDVGLRDDLSEQVLPVFLDLMGSWARNEICIEFTLKILHLILNQGCFEETTWFNFVSEIFRFIQLYSDSESIVGLAMATLARFLIFHPGATSNDQIAVVMETGENVEALRDSMNKFESNENVQKYGCVLFLFLVRKDIDRMRKFGVIEIMGKVVQNFSKTSHVVSTALVAIESLLVDDHSLRDFFDFDIFASVVKAMHYCLSSDVVQEYCLRILIHLAKRDKIIVKKLALTGHVTLGVLALKTALENDWSVAVLTQACIFLNFFANEEFIDLIRDENGFGCALESVIVAADRDINIQLEYNAISILSIAVSFSEDWWESIDANKCLRVTLRLLATYRGQNDVFYLPILAILLALAKHSREVISTVLDSDVMELCKEIISCCDSNDALKLRASELMSVLVQTN